MKPICPECRDNKHVNCSGEAWDNELDKLTVCECTDGACKWAYQ